MPSVCSRGLEVLCGRGQQHYRLIGLIVPQGVQAVADLVSGVAQLALGLRPGIGQAGGGDHGESGADEADDRDPAADPPMRPSVGGDEHGRDRSGGHQGRQAGAVEVEAQEDLHGDSTDQRA